MRRVFTYGSFADLFSRQASRTVRFLQEAAQAGPLHVVVIPDEGTTRYPLAERLYFLQALRYVTTVEAAANLSQARRAPQPGDVLAILEGEDASNLPAAQQFTMEILHITDEQLAGFPPPPETPGSPHDRHVMVTGTFDWLHSGHVRFFEEVSRYGRLTVVVGHDDNIRLLKGPGHPLFGQEERLYMVRSIRYVQQALLSSGHGWLDAEPELERLKPDIYAVNEDGDKPEKRTYCEAHGIQYLVLKRTPKDGLDPRSSTALRGF